MDLLWTDFLNSDWHDWRASGRAEDRLDQPAWLGEFLARWHLSASLPPEPAELTALKEFRALLRRLVEDLVAGAAPGSGDLDQLNRVLAEGPLMRKIAGSDQGQRLELVPLRQDWPQTRAEIAASFALMLDAGEGTHVRICANPDCRWVFYDDTRNQTKRFCDPKLCGNLMKVRRFRTRRKAGADDAAFDHGDQP